METLVCVFVVGRKLVLCKNPLETLDASYCSTDLVSPIQPWKAFPAYPRSIWSRVLCYMDLRRSLRLFFFLWINNTLEIEDRIVLCFNLQLVHYYSLTKDVHTFVIFKESRTF